jgi:hypothetical protein
MPPSGGSLRQCKLHYLHALRKKKAPREALFHRGRLQASFMLPINRRLTIHWPSAN